MNKHSHQRPHSKSRGRQHGQGHKHHPAGWRPHRDWRVWAVALMLLAMAVYVLSLNESIWSGGDRPAVPDARVPAAPAPAGAP